MVEVRQFDPRRQNEEPEAELTEAFERVVRSGQFILGDEVELFEAELAAYVGVTNAIGVGNGSDALQLALEACGVGPGDEVIVPNFTFVASVTAVRWVGATPVLVDVDHDGLIRYRDVLRAWSEKTKAVIAVHLYGQVVPGMDRLRELCTERNAWLIEDAAQALGASDNGRMAGRLGDVGCFSFFPTKTLGGLGDGGACVTHDDRLAERIRMLARHGSRQKYVHVMVGRNSRLDALQAAFLRVKLKYLPDWQQRRTAIAVEYLRGLSGDAAIELPVERPTSVHAWHQFAIHVAYRDRIRAAMASKGVDASVHYPATIADQKFEPTLGARLGEGLATGRTLAARVLCLPIWPEMHDDEVQSVITAVKQAVEAAPPRLVPEVRQPI